MKLEPLSSISFDRSLGSLQNDASRMKDLGEGFSPIINNRAAQQANNSFSGVPMERSGAPANVTYSLGGETAPTPLRTTSTLSHPVEGVQDRLVGEKGLLQGLNTGSFQMMIPSF